MGDVTIHNPPNFSVLSSSISGMLRLVSQSPTASISNPNRTAVTSGGTAIQTFTAGHVGDDTMTFTAPTTVWLKDGATARTTPTNTAVWILMVN